MLLIVSRLAHALHKNNFPIPFDVPSSSSLKIVESKTQIDKEKCTFDQLHLAIIRKDVDSVLAICQNLESKGLQVTLPKQSTINLLLINHDRLKEAFNLTYSLLQTGRYPSAKIFKILLTSLAWKGDYELT